MSSDENNNIIENDKFLDYLELALEEADKYGLLPYSVEMAWNEYKESKCYKQ